MHDALAELERTSDMICVIGRAVLVAGTLLIAAAASAQETDAPATEMADTAAEFC